MIIRLLFCLAFSLQLSAQGDKKEIVMLLEKAKKTYERNNTFKITSLYKLYPSYKTLVPKERYGGIFIKKKDEYYTKIGTTEMVQTKDHQIIVDNKEKKISFSNIDKSSEADKSYDLTQLCLNFNSFVLTETNDVWICTLTAPKVTFVPYSKIIIYLSKKNFTMIKQVLYLLKTVKYKNSQGKIVQNQPKLEIEFTSFNTKIDDMLNKFSPSNYVQVRKKEIQPSEKYLGYKVIE